MCIMGRRTHKLPYIIITCYCPVDSGLYGIVRSVDGVVKDTDGVIGPFKQVNQYCFTYDWCCAGVQLCHFLQRNCNMRYFFRSESLLLLLTCIPSFALVFIHRCSFRHIDNLSRCDRCMSFAYIY